MRVFDSLRQCPARWMGFARSSEAGSLRCELGRGHDGDHYIGKVTGPGFTFENVYWRREKG